MQYCKDIDEMINRFGDDIQVYEADVAYQYACSMCINMRNLFAHDYARVDNEIVWDTLKNNIPGLQEKCEKILDEDLFE